MTLHRPHAEAAPDATRPAPETFTQAVDRVRKGADPKAEARALYALMTDHERLWLLDGDQPFWEGMLSLVEDGYNVYPYVMGAVDRLGVPGVRFADGPRGSVLGRSLLCWVRASSRCTRSRSSPSPGSASSAGSSRPCTDSARCARTRAPREGSPRRRAIP